MDIIQPSFLILGRFYRTPGVNLKLLLSDSLDDIPAENHQGITRTVYGVVRQEKKLDFLIDRYSARKTSKLDIEALLMLRIGFYLMFFSDSYPSYAVVNEIVEAASHRIKGFLNAILRRCSKQKNVLIHKLNAIRDPHIKYSISELLIKQLKRISDNSNADLEYLDSEPVFHLRVNTEKYKIDEIKKILTENKISFRELSPLGSLEIGGAAGRVRELLKEGKYFYFQDAASQLISIIASQFARERVLDVCAAPGTKSVTLRLLNENIKIVANDVHPGRIGMLKEFCHDYGITGIETITSDAKQPGVKNGFDFILLDAPCTSSGTLRKNPDLKLKITPELVEKNTGLQREILASTINDFSIPGEPVHFLYSVCSFIKAETDDIIDTVVNENIEIIDISNILDEYGFRYKRGNHGYFLLPAPELNNDLFYISLLKIIPR